MEKVGLIPDALRLSGLQDASRFVEFARLVGRIRRLRRIRRCPSPHGGVWVREKPHPSPLG